MRRLKRSPIGAGQIARKVADEAPHKVIVAGSLPPLFESYRPDRFVATEAPDILAPLVAGLGPYVDVWLIETQSSIITSCARPMGVEVRPTDRRDKHGTELGRCPQAR